MAPVHDAAANGKRPPDDEDLDVRARKYVRFTEGDEVLEFTYGAPPAETTSKTQQTTLLRVCLCNRP